MPHSISKGNSSFTDTISPYVLKLAGFFSFDDLQYVKYNFTSVFSRKKSILNSEIHGLSMAMKSPWCPWKLIFPQYFSATLKFQSKYFRNPLSKPFKTQSLSVFTPLFETHPLSDFTLNTLKLACSFIGKMQREQLGFGEPAHAYRRINWMVDCPSII